MFLQSEHTPACSWHWQESGDCVCPTERWRLQRQNTTWLMSIPKQWVPSDKILFRQEALNEPKLVHKNLMSVHITSD